MKGHAEQAIRHDQQRRKTTANCGDAPASASVPAGKRSNQRDHTRRKAQSQTRPAQEADRRAIDHRYSAQPEAPGAQHQQQRQACRKKLKPACAGWWAGHETSRAWLQLRLGLMTTSAGEGWRLVVGRLGHGLVPLGRRYRLPTPVAGRYHYRDRRLFLAKQDLPMSRDTASPRPVLDQAQTSVRSYSRRASGPMPMTMPDSVCC